MVLFDKNKTSYNLLIMNTSDTINIRSIEESDYAVLLDLYNREENMRYIPGNINKLSDKEKVARWKRNQAKYISQAGIFIATEKESNQVIGEIALFDSFNSSECMEIGIILDLNYWGKGYGYLVTYKICKDAFKKLSLQSVVARMYKENKRSIQLMERIGFTRINEDVDKDGKTYYTYKLLKENLNPIEA